MTVKRGSTILGITDAMVDQRTLRKLLERRARKRHLAPRPKAKRNARRRSRAVVTKGWRSS